MTPRKSSQPGASSRTRRTTSGSSRTASRTKPAASRGAGSKPRTSRPARAQREIARHWSVPVLAALFVGVLLAASYYPAMKVQYREMRQKSRLEVELAGLRARNERLRQQVARLKTPEGIEDLARTQLGLVKKGENVAVIVDGDSKTATATVVPRIESEVPRAAAQQPSGTWTAFLDAFFGMGN